MVTHAGPPATFGFGQGRYGELGFHVLRFSAPAYLSDPSLLGRQIVLPLWLPALAALVPGSLALRRFVARKRRRSGSCPACSYDLTGNVSGVCPECGTAIAKGNA